jgi:hypothetical protein
MGVGKKAADWAECTAGLSTAALHAALGATLDPPLPKEGVCKCGHRLTARTVAGGGGLWGREVAGGQWRSGTVPRRVQATEREECEPTEWQPRRNPAHRPWRHTPQPPPRARARPALSLLRPCTRKLQSALAVPPSGLLDSISLSLITSSGNGHEGQATAEQFVGRRCLRCGEAASFVA